MVWWEAGYLGIMSLVFGLMAYTFYNVNRQLYFMLYRCRNRASVLQNGIIVAH